MKTTLKLEEATQLILGILIFNQLHYAWWVFAALILTPDISMLGYIAGNKIGAAVYNIFHHKGIAIAIAALGFYMHVETVILAGIILFSHAAMDRIMGYGLKYEQGFKFTHLGDIGKG